VLRDPYGAAIACGLALYVAVEAAVYVWMPTLVSGLGEPTSTGAGAALTLFFGLRMAGRFAGPWLLDRVAWTTLLAAAGSGVFLCFAGAIASAGAAPILLPLSGLFMSVIYPTLNSKGMSGFPRARHGAAAGALLFATCTGAVAGPLAMGAFTDRTADPRTGFLLATALAAALCVGLLWNWIADPTRARLHRVATLDYPDTGG
jgi:fucose permease